MVEQWLQKYAINSIDDELSALREIYQEIVLAGLARTDFFSKATFYGGIALRIIYNIPRYSEDIDFSLNSTDPEFTLENYFDAILEEFKILDLTVKIEGKKKNVVTDIDSAFLKQDPEYIKLIFDHERKSLLPSIRIKIEVDTDPPLKFDIEPKLLLLPYSFYVNVMKPEDLFAGKMSAVLYRDWKNRVKGRDWYDLEWYIRNNIPLNIIHFKERLMKSGFLSADIEFTPDDLIKLLNDKIDSINIEDAKFDAMRFVHNKEDLRIWSRQYFHDLVRHLKFKN